MKKIALKIVGIAAFAALIALNVTSTMEFSPGGEEVKAAMQSDIPCYSAYTTSHNSYLVFCLGCKKENGTHSGVNGTCDPDGN